MKRGVTSLLMAHYSSVIIFVCCYVTCVLVAPETGAWRPVCIVINVLPFCFQVHFIFNFAKCT